MSSPSGVPKIQDCVEKATKYLELGWTQKVSARDVSDNPVRVYDDEACKYCASGAVRRAAADIYDDPDSNKCHKFIKDTYFFLAMKLPHQDWHILGETILEEEVIISFNDHIGRTQEEVVEFFKSALLGS